jgi:hypothetical protein
MRFVLGKWIEHTNVLVSASDERHRTRLEQARTRERVAQLRRHRPQRRVVRRARPIGANLIR